MFIRKVESTYGRVVEKPGESLNKPAVVDESSIPIQDQIENLKTKISLKARYNKVISEEFNENQQGATAILGNLYHETKNLRMDLMLALNSEQAAIRNALGTYVRLQLALRGKNYHEAIPWLEDELFDLIKHLNQVVYDLKMQRSRMEDAELMITLLEKYPKPGSLPWEIFAALEMETLENKISNMRAKLEAAAIMNSSYWKIKDMLQKDADRFNPIRESLEEQLKFQKHELETFEQMLLDANYFLEEAEANMVLIETQCRENKRARRGRMGKVRKEVGEIVVKNKSDLTAMNSEDAVASNIFLYKQFEQTNTKKITQEMIDDVQRQIKDYELRTELLVTSMRIPNVNKIPQRMKEVGLLGEYLDSQLQMMEDAKGKLINEKSYLSMLKMDLNYTGSQLQEKLTKTTKNYEEESGLIEKELQELHQRRNCIGASVFDLQLSAIACMSQLEEGKKNRANYHQMDINHQLQRLNHRIRRLSKQLRTQKELFPDEDEEKDYSNMIKPKPTPAHLIRISTPVPSDNESSDDEDEFFHSEVPNADDIKKAGKKHVQRTIIRRGLH